MSAVYVGIDPGVHACGVAACDAYGLLGALWARTDTKDALHDDVAVAAMRGVRIALQTRASVRNGDIVVGVEFPEVAPDGRARGAAKTEDLLELSFVVGRVVEHVQSSMAGAHVVRVPVSSWKRGLPTDVIEQRLKLPPPVGLSPAERASVAWPAPSYRHNVVDAVALAKWLAEWPKKNPSKNLKDFARL